MKLESGIDEFSLEPEDTLYISLHLGPVGFALIVMDRAEYENHTQSPKQGQVPTIKISQSARTKP